MIRSASRTRGNSWMERRKVRAFSMRSRARRPRSPRAPVMRIERRLTVHSNPKVADGQPMSEVDYLTNQLLIAMPAMGDPNFAQTVTLVCDHSARGALGLILNKP